MMRTLTCLALSSCLLALTACSNVEQEIYQTSNNIFSSDNSNDITPEQEELLAVLGQEFGEKNILVLYGAPGFEKTTENQITNEFVANYMHNFYALSGTRFPSYHSKRVSKNWIGPSEKLMQRGIANQGVNEELLQRQNVFDELTDLSSTSIIQTESGLLGTVVIADKKILIRPLGAGAHAFIQSADDFPPDHDFDELEEVEQDELDDEVESIQTEIKVLHIFTKSAEKKILKSSFPRLSDFTQLALKETNLSLKHHGLAFRVRDAGVKLVDYKSSTSYKTDVNRLAGTNDGFLDAVHKLRVDSAADVVALIVDIKGSCGRAKSIGSTYETAFFVVNYKCATGYYSYGHELGHLLGARHNIQKDPKGDYNHGYYIDGRGWRSVMSYNCPSKCVRYPEWSDPSKKLSSGESKGQKGKSENQRVWAIQGYKIASLFENRHSSNTVGEVEEDTSIADE